MSGNNFEIIDFHSLSEKIHKIGNNNEEHWDELIVRYLQCELVNPLRKSIKELVDVVEKLNRTVESIHIVNTSTSESQEFLMLPEVSRILKVHGRTVMKLVKKGKLHAAKIGGVWRFDKATVIKYGKGEY